MEDKATVSSNPISPSPLGEGLVTLTTLPKSHWHNLHNLDIIKVCVYMYIYEHVHIIMYPLRIKICTC